MRAVESGLRVSETRGGEGPSRSGPARPPGDVSTDSNTDPFLNQLEEIQAALRKRTRA
jgi:hypothetical protein